jgi:hypothetical protein
MEEIGHSHKDVLDALQRIGAAKGSGEPDKLVHSLDRAIQALKR